MRKIFTIVFMAVMISALLLSSGVAATGEIAKIKERGKIIIGVFTDKPPFGYMNEKGENDGFDIAIAKRFAKDLLGDESKIEWVVVEPASRIPFLQSNKVDLIMANMTVTPERQQVVDFTNPYMKVAIQVLANDKANIKSVKDLYGKTIIVVKGTTADILFTKKYPKIQLLKFDQNTEAFQALKDGRGAGLAHDNLLLFAWANENSGFSIVNQKLEDPAPIAPAVKKGNIELRNWINDEFKRLAKENYLHKLYDEQLKKAFGKAVRSPEDVILEGGILK